MPNSGSRTFKPPGNLGTEPYEISFFVAEFREIFYYFDILISRHNVLNFERKKFKILIPKTFRAPSPLPLLRFFPTTLKFFPTTLIFFPTTLIFFPTTLIFFPNHLNILPNHLDVLPNHLDILPNPLDIFPKPL